MTDTPQVGENSDYAVACEAEVMAGNKKVFGPLSKSVADAGSELGMDLMDQVRRGHVLTHH